MNRQSPDRDLTQEHQTLYEAAQARACEVTRMMHAPMMQTDA